MDISEEIVFKCSFSKTASPFVALLLFELLLKDMFSLYHYWFVKNVFSLQPSQTPKQMPPMQGFIYLTYLQETYDFSTLLWMVFH